MSLFVEGRFCNRLGPTYGVLRGLVNLSDDEGDDWASRELDSERLSRQVMASGILRGAKTSSRLLAASIQEPIQLLETPLVARCQLAGQ